MELSAMRYKNYVWPHNPRVYEMSFRSRISEHGYPGGTYALQYMGRGCRVFRGEGEFCGEGAYDEFTKLANTFYDPAPGLLIHPLWQPTMVYLVSLRCRETPKADFVSYAFEFWECPPDEQPEITSSAAVYTAAGGETLSRIAAVYGESTESLIAANPDLRNPSRIEAGTKITIREETVR